MKIVEINNHSILRKQKKNPPDKPVEIDWFIERGSETMRDVLEDILRRRKSA